LDALVEQAQQTINASEPQTLRTSNRLRQMVARDLEQIQASVGDLLVDRPRRNILRRTGRGAVLTTEMELVVDAGGSVRCIYDEVLDLREIGKLQITRASRVEPDAEGSWWADTGPSG